MGTNLDTSLLGGLRCFESSGRLLSFTRAAAELNLTQSAVSQQIRHLENRLGYPLFVRHPRGLELTSKGVVLIEVTSRLINELQQTINRLSLLNDILPVYKQVLIELGKRGIAFICSREKVANDSIGPLIKAAFGGPYIVNERFDKASSNAAIANGTADAVAFGVPFIANPDLPARLKLDAPLNEARPESFYAKGPVGYIDYPRL